MQKEAFCRLCPRWQNIIRSLSALFGGREEPVCALFQNKEPESDSEEKKEVLILAEEDSAFRRQIKNGLKKEFCVVEACDGREVLRLLSWYKKRTAGVILSLTLPDPEAEEKALEAGADDFIGKPFAVKSLLKRLKRASEVIDLRAREEIL